MDNRLVLEHRNLKSGKKTTYYVHQGWFFASCVYLIGALLFNSFDLTMSIFLFFAATVVFWQAVDFEETDLEPEEEGV